MRRTVFSSGLPARAVSYTVQDTAGFAHRPDSPGTAKELLAVRGRRPSGRADGTTALRPVDERAPLSRVPASHTQAAQKPGRVWVVVYGPVRRIGAGTGRVRERGAERDVPMCPPIRSKATGGSDGRRTRRMTGWTGLRTPRASGFFPEKYGAGCAAERRLVLPAADDLDDPGVLRRMGLHALAARTGHALRAETSHDPTRLPGTVITLDVLHTPRKTASIITQTADTVFTVTGNAPETFDILATIDWDIDQDRGHRSLHRGREHGSWPPRHSMHNGPSMSLHRPSASSPIPVFDRSPGSPATANR